MTLKTLYFVLISLSCLKAVADNSAFLKKVETFIKNSTPVCENLTKRLNKGRMTSSELIKGIQNIPVPSKEYLNLRKKALLLQPPVDAVFAFLPLESLKICAEADLFNVVTSVLKKERTLNLSKKEKRRIGKALLSVSSRALALDRPGTLYFFGILSLKLVEKGYLSASKNQLKALKAHLVRSKKLNEDFTRNLEQAVDVKDLSRAHRLLISSQNKIQELREDAQLMATQLLDKN